MRMLGQHLIQTRTASSSFLEIHRARTVGGIYTDTFATHHQPSQWGGNDPNFLTGGKMGIIYVGGKASWDQLLQVNTSIGDGFAVYFWGIYSLDDNTLLPNALLWDPGAWTTYTGAPGTKIVSINGGAGITTTCNWIGLGICCVGTNAGAGRPTFVSSAPSLSGTQYVGFYPYGVSTPPANATTPPAWNGLQMTSTTQNRNFMAAASAWTIQSSVMDGSSGTNVDGGLWIRRSG